MGTDNNNTATIDGIYKVLMGRGVEVIKIGRSITLANRVWSDMVSVNYNSTTMKFVIKVRDIIAIEAHRHHTNSEMATLFQLYVK